MHKWRNLSLVVQFHSRTKGYRNSVNRTTCSTNLGPDEEILLTLEASRTNKYVYVSPWKDFRRTQQVLSFTTSLIAGTLLVQYST